MTIIRFLSIALLGGLLIACNGLAQQSGANKTIPPAEFEQKLAQSDVQVVDVRSPEEFASGGLPGAVNYNVNGGDFEKNLDKLDKSKPVLVYCLSGGRSGKAAEMMASKGFKEVYNMDGGMVRWRAEGRKAPAAKSGMSLSAYNDAVSKPGYVLVDFNAAWCAPCKKMLPWITKLADERKSDLSLLKIDADANAQLLSDKGIKGIPHLELYRDGKRIWEKSGYIEEADFRQQTGL